MLMGVSTRLTHQAGWQQTVTPGLQQPNSYTCVICVHESIWQGAQRRDGGQKSRAELARSSQDRVLLPARQVLCCVGKQPSVTDLAPRQREVQSGALCCCAQPSHIPQLTACPGWGV